MATSYGLYYCEEFPIRSAEYLHIGDTPQTEIDLLIADLKSNGLRNPLWVFAQEGKLVIHPGKCRAQALLALGIEHARAVIYAPDSWQPEGFERIPPEEAARMFTKDMKMFYTGQDARVARLRQPVAPIPTPSPLRGRKPVYTLAYVRHFDIKTADRTLIQPKTSEIEFLMSDIAQNGLKNPLFGTKDANRIVIHPGKHRAAALVALGRSHAPALIYCPTGGRIAEGSPITPERATELFCEDLICEWDFRFFAVKRVGRKR